MRKEFFVAMAAALLLTGCGGAGGTAGVSNDVSIQTEMAGADYFADAAGEASETRDVADLGAGDAEASEVPVKENRKLIKTISLRLETTDFQKSIVLIGEKVNAVGGYIEHSGVSGNSVGSDGQRYADYTLRVPQEKLDEFAESIKEAGSITYREDDVRDITLDYTDVESRLRSLQIEQARLWELLEKADNIETIVAINERLSEVNYQLDSYESKLKVYDNRVAYSTVDLTVNEVRTYTEQAKDGMGTRIAKGFQKNITSLMTTCENVIVWFFSNILTIGLIAFAVLIALVVGYKVEKKNRQKGNGEKAEAGEIEGKKDKTAIDIGEPKE